MRSLVFCTLVVLYEVYNVSLYIVHVCFYTQIYKVNIVEVFFDSFLYCVITSIKIQSCFYSDL